MNRAIAGAFLFLLGAVTAVADTARYKVYTENLPPVSYADGTQVSGLATEIVEEMFARAGEDATFKVYPWARAYESVLADETGIICTLGRNEKREQSFQWIGPILIREVGEGSDLDFTMVSNVGRRYETAIRCDIEI